MGILEMDFERILGVPFFHSSSHSIMLWFRTVLIESGHSTTTVRRTTWTRWGIVAVQADSWAAVHCGTGSGYSLLLLRCVCRRCTMVQIFILTDCSEMKENDKWPFYDHFRPFFFGNYMTIFHKTEVHSVILRCLTGLNLDLFKSYDSK